MKRYLLIFSSLLLCASEPIPVTIGTKLSEVIQVSGLTRVVVSNGKVLRARVIPPSSLNLTGLARGQSQVTVWTQKGMKNYLVTVISGRSRDLLSTGRNSVVRVSLEFLELSEAFGSATGIQWPQLIRFGAMSSLQGNFNTTGLNYTATFQSAKGWFQHMVHEGWAKVLASPELYVRVGEEAVFHSGGEFPVTNATENYGKSYQHVEWKKYGLTTKVRPESGDNLHIHSDINIEISELDRSHEGDGIPSLTRRNLTTKMDSLDGETVVLSGLVRRASQLSIQRVPWLGSIPLLGVFFRRTNEGDETTELLMAVTFSFSTRSREIEKREGFQQRWERKRRE